MCAAPGQVLSTGAGLALKTCITRLWNVASVLDARTA